MDPVKLRENVWTYADLIRGFANLPEKRPHQELLLKLLEVLEANEAARARVLSSSSEEDEEGDLCGTETDSREDEDEDKENIWVDFISDTDEVDESAFAFGVVRRQPLLGNDADVYDDEYDIPSDRSVLIPGEDGSSPRMHHTREEVFCSRPPIGVTPLTPADRNRFMCKIVIKFDLGIV